MKLLIGCPVFRREWIIGEYLEYADKAARMAGHTPGYVFCGPGEDATVPVIHQWLNANGRRGYFVFVDQDDAPGEHEWNEQRYEWMARLRNALLEEVRYRDPDLFLSLDSDILLHAEALQGALEGIDAYAAVGMKTYLSIGTECPNYAKMIGGNLHRPDFEGFAEVDVIMAAKLMKPAAYNVDYVAHHLGEDIGWSKEVRSRGYRLGFDGRHPSKHVMNHDELYRFDGRVGW